MNGSSPYASGFSSPSHSSMAWRSVVHGGGGGVGVACSCFGVSFARGATTIVHDCLGGGCFKVPVGNFGDDDFVGDDKEWLS